MTMKRIKQKQEHLRKLRELGARFNLTFCKYASLGNKLLGLDGRKRKLFVTGKDQLTDESHIIDLENVKSVSVVKHYGSIRAGELNQRRFDDFLQLVHLRFEYLHKGAPISLSFYDGGVGTKVDKRRLISRSKLMQAVLSKFIASFRVTTT